MRKGSVAKPENVWAKPPPLAQAVNSQTIDEHQPGTILRDFETLLAFIGEEGLPVASELCLLPINRLDELNSRMTHPIVHAQKRPQQKSFPLLHGLFMLLRTSGLGIGTQSGSKRRLVIDARQLSRWRELNPTERYFALVESWLILGNVETIGEHSGMRGGGFHSLMWTYQKLQESRSIKLAPGVNSPFYGTEESMTLALTAAFGWLHIEYGVPPPGKGVQLASVARTTWGDAMIGAFRECYFSQRWPEEFGALHPYFQPLFPLWRQTLALPDEPVREGVYVWRVTLGKAWRRIAAPDDATLDELAQAILESVNFDNDHLYCFMFRGRNGKQRRVACPMENDAEIFTDELTLGELPIFEGSSMVFEFDYGESWRFDVKLEKIRPPDAELDCLQLLAQGGRAPKQYDWDDDDDEDEVEDDEDQANEE